MGTLLLKDIIIIFSFALFTLSVLNLVHKNSTFLQIIFMVLSVFLIGITRLPLIVFLLLIYLIMQKVFYLRQVFWFGGIVLTLIFLMPYILQFTMYEFSGEFVFDEVVVNKVIEDKLVETSSGTPGVVQTLVGGYTDLPTLLRFIYLPIFVAIQYVMPINFWSTSFINDHPWYFLIEQLNVLWYGLIGVLFIYSIINIRLIKNIRIKRLFIIGIIFYVLTAFIYGGAIPRYAFPSFVLILPTFGYMFYQFKNDMLLRKSIITFLKKYYAFGLLLFLLYLLKYTL